MDAMKELIEAAEVMLSALNEDPHDHGLDIPCDTCNAYGRLNLARIKAAELATQQSKTVRVWVAIHPTGMIRLCEGDIPPGQTTLGYWFCGDGVKCISLHDYDIQLLGLPKPKPGECHQYEITTRKVEE